MLADYYTHGWLDAVLIALLVMLLIRAATWKGGTRGNKR